MRRLGAVNVTGKGWSGRGIGSNLSTGSQFNAGSGGLIFNGSDGLDGDGINLASGTFQATGGNVTMDGVGGVSGGSGTYIGSSTIVRTNISGDVTLHGEAQGANSAALQAYGAIDSTNGVIHLNGLGAAALTDTAYGDAVYLGGSIGSSNTAGINIIGQARSGSASWGVDMGSATLATANSGNIAIEGLGRNGRGVSADAAHVNAGSGGLMIHGADIGTNGRGLYAKGTTFTASGGNVSVTGISAVNGSNTYDATHLEDATVQTIGSGNINITGTAYGTGSGITTASSNPSLVSTLVSSGGTGAVTLNGTANSSGNGLNLDHTTIRSDSGTILAQGSSNTNTGIYFNPLSNVSIISNNGADIYLVADSLSLSGSGNIVQSSGNLYVQTLADSTAIHVGGNSASLNLLADYFSGANRVFADGFNSINIGKSTNTGGLVVSTATNITDTTRLIQGTGNITINDALTITPGNTLTVNTSGTGMQGVSGSIGADGLALTGVGGNFVFNSVANAVTTLAANTGQVDFVNSDALTIDAVDNQIGINATGKIKVATRTGDLTINQNITTMNSASSANGLTPAILLNAGEQWDAITHPDGGDIKFGAATPTFATGAGGQVALLTGSIAGTTGVAAVIGSGSQRFRYGSDETTTSYVANLGAGQYLVYREQPTISATVGNVSKTYDGQAFSGSVAFNAAGDVNGDIAGVTGNAISSPTDINAGIYSLNIDPASITSAASELGYAVNFNSTGTLIINQRAVSLSGSRVYNATTNIDASILTIDNLVNGESLSLSGVGLTADKNVGSGKVLALNTLTLGNGSGGLASNYIFTGGTYTVDISKAELTTTLSADNKVYDATTAATVHDNGITALGMDDVSLTGSASGQFDSKHVGTGKTVSINNGYSLTGADAGNYNLVANATTSADISKAELTIDAVTDTKAYDGTTDSIRFANVKGLQGSDSIVGLTQSFDSKDVGDRILAVNAGYIFNDGANGGNYDVVTNVAKGKITAQPNTINLPLTPPPVINYPSLAPRNIEPVFNPDIEHPVSIIVYRHGDSGVVENAVVIKHEASGVSLTPSNFKSTSFTQPGDLQEKLTYTVNHNGYSAQFSISTTETGVLISPLSNEGVAITEQSREKVISLGLVALIDQQSYQVQLLRNIYIDLQK